MYVTWQMCFLLKKTLTNVSGKCASNPENQKISWHIFPLLLRLKKSKKQGTGIKYRFIEFLLIPDPTTNGMQNTNCDPGKQPRGFWPRAVHPLIKETALTSSLQKAPMEAESTMVGTKSDQFIQHPDSYLFVEHLFTCK